MVAFIFMDQPGSTKLQKLNSKVILSFSGFSPFPLMSQDKTLFFRSAACNQELEDLRIGS